MNFELSISATLTPDEYLTERMMSKLPVLLVEGEFDDIFFQLVRDELLSNDIVQLPLENAHQLRSIQIETPQMIASPDGEKLGHREKVELVCGLAGSDVDRTKLVGFVDREFRRFIATTILDDYLECSCQFGRVRWSRGHSIENIFFDYAIMRPVFRDLGVSSYYNVAEALAATEEHFDDALRVACALSLVGKDQELLGMLYRTISSEHIRLGEKNIEFDVRLWATHLRERHKLDSGRVAAVVSAFAYYMNVVARSNMEVVRWMCHGHLGETVLWSAFGAAVHLCCEKNGVPTHCRKVVSVSSRDRLIRYVGSWIRHAFHKSTDNSPLECFRDFGIRC
ncbi:MAG: DUF4435 domain-containing protein [Longimicrobiaceae bacterium]